MTHRIRESIVHFAQGLLMGGADIIPGVSGGTMALIVGIYRRLIAALSSGFSSVVALLRLDVRQARIRLTEVEWTLVFPLLVGIVSALLIGARFIPFLLETYPHECMGLFFGLVAGSIAIPWRRVDRYSGPILFVAAAAAVLAFILTGIPPQESETPTMLKVFAAASVAICAMILPGVSGAFLLKVFGMYEVTLQALNTGNVGFVAVFIAGAVCGLGLFSKLLNLLLSRWTSMTMAALVGLMVGALRALWPWQAADRALQLPGAGDPVWSVVGLGLAGFAFVTLLAFWGSRIEHGLENMA
jgi:putative membrane protein